MKVKSINIWGRIVIAMVLFIATSIVSWNIPIKGFDGDCWRDWTIHIYRHGLMLAYHSGADYPPFYLYILYLFGKVWGSEQAIVEHIASLKSVTFMFDFWGLWYVYRWIDKKVDFVLLLLVSVFNIAYSYNSVIWGQVDGIMSTLVFISIYYAWKQRNILSAVWFVLAVNMKLQAIIFLPVWGLISLYNALDRKNVKPILKQLAIILLVQFILILPFLPDKYERDTLWRAVTTAAGRYPFLSYNAFNLWYFISPDPFHTKDELAFGGISCNNIGHMLFFTVSFIVLWPLLRNVFLKFKNSNTALLSKEKLWLMCSLVVLSFFYFNTQMHERYCHPAFIFLTAYSFYSRDFIPYVLFSAAYFLNLEGIYRWLELPNYDTLIFSPAFIAGLNGILIMYLMYKLYRREKAVQA